MVFLFKSVMFEGIEVIGLGDGFFLGLFGLSLEILVVELVLWFG